MQDAGRGRKSASNTLACSLPNPVVSIYVLTRSPAVATAKPTPSSSDRHMQLSGAERAG